MQIQIAPGPRRGNRVIEAEPGYGFTDEVGVLALAPAAVRAVGGYLPDRAEMDAGFVAWGRGLRRGLRGLRVGAVHRPLRDAGR